MTARISSCLMKGEPPVQNLFQDWRKQYHTDRDEGSRSILQLYIDLTGYGYVLQTNDALTSSGLRELVQRNITQSRFQYTDVYNQPEVLERLYGLLKLMIVHNSQELLQDNVWFNRTICLLVGFCESKDESCVMTSGYLSTLLLVHISVVRKNVQENLENARLHDDDDEDDALQEIELRAKNLLKCSTLLMRNIGAGCRHPDTVDTISDLFCRLLETYPEMYMLDQNALDVLSGLLRLRHVKTFKVVTNCFKTLSNPDYQSTEVVDAMARYFFEVAGKNFIQAMLTFKSSVKAAMEVIAYMQKRNLGKPLFDEQINDKLRQFMFHGDGLVRAYAIDFHVSTMRNREYSNGEVLVQILKLYVKYEHSIESLGVLVEHLWQLEFFVDWSVLFGILAAEMAEEDNLFMIISVVSVITRCFDLLLKDLASANEPEQDKVDQNQMKQMLQQFLKLYPAALRNSFGCQLAYVKMLYPAYACHHDSLIQFNNNLGAYYEALFGVLERVAYKCTDFFTLRTNLMVIRSYWSVVMDVETIWSELIDSYSKEFCDNRLRINSQRIEPDVMEVYYLNLVRLTALLDVNPYLGYYLQDVANLVSNDLSLLDKLQFDPLQASMFYRLYKCVLHTIIKGNQPTPETSGDPETWAQLPKIPLKKRVLQLLRILIKHLDRTNEPLDVCVNVFTSLCDMLIITQDSIAELDIPELADLGYQVRPVLLEQMAKFLLNYLFSTEYDWHENPIMKQRQMLDKYIELYQEHRSLPRVIDTQFLVVNYSFDTHFERQLQRLMLVLHKADTNQFCEVISQAAYELLLFYKSESSVKNFFKKFQSFALAKLTVDDQEECSNVIARVVEKVLNHTMSVILDDKVAPEVTRMFKLVQPLLPQMQVEDRLALEHLLVRRQEYEKLPDAERKTVNKFIKRLHK